MNGDTATEQIQRFNFNSIPYNCLPKSRQDPKISQCAHMLNDMRNYYFEMSDDISDTDCGNVELNAKHPEKCNKSHSCNFLTPYCNLTSDPTMGDCQVRKGDTYHSEWSYKPWQTYYSCYKKSGRLNSTFLNTAMEDSMPWSYNESEKLSEAEKENDMFSNLTQKHLLQKFVQDFISLCQVEESIGMKIQQNIVF